MADQDIIHTAEIIKAAIPYVDTRFKGMAELFAKALDLMGSLKSAGNSDNVAAYGFQSTIIFGIIIACFFLCGISIRISFFRATGIPEI